MRLYIECSPETRSEELGAGENDSVPAAFALQMGQATQMRTLSISNADFVAVVRASESFG